MVDPFREMTTMDKNQGYIFGLDNQAAIYNLRRSEIGVDRGLAVVIEENGTKVLYSRDKSAVHGPRQGIYLSELLF